MEHLQSDILRCQHTTTITFQGHYNNKNCHKFILCSINPHKSFVHLLHSVKKINLLNFEHPQLAPQLDQVVVLCMELSCISPAHSLSCVEGFLSPMHTHTQATFLFEYKVPLTSATCVSRSFA